MKTDNIKKLLLEISPWPWENQDTGYIWSKNGNIICERGENSQLGNFSFIAQSPQIIDQLVKQNEILKEALNKYTENKWSQADVGAQTDYVLDDWMGFPKDEMPWRFAEEALQKCEELENE